MKYIAALAITAAALVLAVGGSPWGSVSAANERGAGQMSVRNLPKAEQIALAYRAVFGDGPMGLTDADGQNFDFSGGDIVWLRDSAVLLVPGAAADAGAATVGTLGLFYLKPARNGFVEIARFPFFIDGNIMGNPPTWEISTAFMSDVPVIVSTAGGVWQGIRCRRTTITGLFDKAPGEIISFASEYDASGAGKKDRLTGKIARIMLDKSFDVNFTGSRSFTHRYLRSFDGYDRIAANPPQELPEC